MSYSEAFKRSDRRIKEVLEQDPDYRRYLLEAWMSIGSETSEVRESSLDHTPTSKDEALANAREGI